MGQMTTAEAIVAALIAHGLDTLYALPGVQNDHLFDALFKSSELIRTVHTRHEQGAAYMALGAALATGRPQACAVVPGPGPAQRVGRAADRLFDERAGARAGRPDSRRRYRPRARAPARDQRPGRDHRAPGRSREAGPQPGDRAEHGRRGVPRDGERPPRTGRARMRDQCLGQTGRRDAAGALPVEQPAIDEDALRDAAKRLGAAKNPMIVVGGGAQDASPEVTQLAGMLQAPVLCGFRRGQGVLDSAQSARRHAAARPRIVGRGRRGAGGRHAAVLPAHRCGASTTISRSSRSMPIRPSPASIAIPRSR